VCKSCKTCFIFYFTCDRSLRWRLLLCLPAERWSHCRRLDICTSTSSHSADNSHTHRSSCCLQPHLPQASVSALLVPRRQTIIEHCNLHRDMSAVVVLSIGAIVWKLTVYKNIIDVKSPPAHLYTTIFELVRPFDHSMMPWKFRDSIANSSGVMASTDRQEKQTN